MRGIASRFVVSSLLSSEAELGEPPETTLFSLASVWIFVSWDCRGLHASNAPISSAIRMTSITSALTGTYHCHPRTPTLVIARNCDGMFLFYGNEFSHWLVKNLTTWTTGKGSVNRWSQNHDWDIGRMFCRRLLRNAWFSIRFKVRRMVRRLFGIFEFGLGSIDLGRMTSEFLSLEISEPTTWEVTSAWVQKHNLSTITGGRGGVTQGVN